jgi:hypothetical protein
MRGPSPAYESLPWLPQFLYFFEGCSSEHGACEQFLKQDPSKWFWMGKARTISILFQHSATFVPEHLEETRLLLIGKVPG